MRRAGNLWPRVVSMENLLEAARRAQRGKRFRENVLPFNFRRETELLQIQQELIAKTYLPGAYRTFEIVEPKRRLISAAPYRDRVVHHALCNVIAPIFERTFIFDSYANRLGKGTRKALDRFVAWTRSSRWILQCDVRKYFASIDHEILKSIIRRTVKCRDTLWLMDRILDSSNEQEPVQEWFAGDDLLEPAGRRKGLPIGNLTSQLFANVYLSGFDHWVKEELRAKRYIRYVDDFALFSNDRGELAGARPAIEKYLAGLRLRIHPVKSQLFEGRRGATFLGFRILPDRIRVRYENLRRARRRLRDQAEEFGAGRLPFAKLHQSIRSWISHVTYGNTVRLRAKVFSTLVFASA